MCGFAGEFLLVAGRADLALAGRMAAALRHRGPDSAGTYLSPDGRLAIGFQRLAIIDPPASQQPMSTPDGQLTVAFNGEIYNFRQLRKLLQSDGANFTTQGDTEVLLHLYRRRGAEMLHDLQGMFAYIIYDAARQTLMFARDRIGQKPFWYAVLSDRVVFASEAKAILLHPGVDRSIDHQSLTYFMTFGYIPAPRSGWVGIRKLPAGSYMSIDSAFGQPKRYWTAPVKPAAANESQLLEVTRVTVDKAVADHLVADVPVGSLLSGGIDSSIVTALMVKHAGNAGGVKTFTAGFDDAEYDERPLARRTAEHLGTEHTEILVRPQLSGLADRMVSLYDEPFADSSALPTWLICQAAGGHVKAALTGDGGDEAFAGYDRHRAMYIGATVRPPTYAALRLAGFLAGAFGPKDERSPLRRLARFARTLPYPYADQYFMHRGLFDMNDLGDLFTADFEAQNNLDAPYRWFCELYEDNDIDDEVARCQYHDIMTYLPDDLLVKTDIAAMSHSLELRPPLLDPAVIELGLSLPVGLKVNRRRGKLALRRAFADLLPPEVFAARKRGFGIPLGRWLRKELRSEMEETLLDQSFLDSGIFRPSAIRGLVNDHLSGKDDHRHRLWALMVLARWLARSWQGS